VGVVGDVRQSGLDRPVAPEIYYPFAQNAAAAPDVGISLIVNTIGPPEAVAGPVRRAIHAVNPNQAIFDMRTMEKVISESHSDLNLYLWLVGLFAAIALALAIAGIYGVMSYAVAARVREFGIRLALGANKSILLKLVLGHAGRLIASGLILGSAGAFTLEHVLMGFVRGVPRLDSVVLCEASALFASVAILACFGPAIKASKVDPNVNLRCE
jgi:ABC-type antimicrobial peptide transport system permease subunit